MSAFRNYLVGAMVKKLRPSSLTKGLIDLTKLIKDEITGFGIAVHDPCCPADATKRPMWFNATLGKPQYLSVDGTTVITLNYTVASSIVAPVENIGTPTDAPSTETPS